LLKPLDILSIREIHGLGFHGITTIQRIAEDFLFFCIWVIHCWESIDLLDIRFVVAYWEVYSFHALVFFILLIVYERFNIVNVILIITSEFFVLLLFHFSIEHSIDYSI
jgi:hypothetical protein